MSFDKDFNPVLRFTVVSDVHYKDEHTVERERMEQAIKTSYALAEKENYSAVDALYVVGDFANNGSPTQMEAFRKTLDDNISPGTEVTVSIATHEFGFNGEEGAIERLKSIFGAEPDTHKVINGFHFISVSCGAGCRFREAKQEWVARELAIAAADDPSKPIFFFQHPHITNTVSGSICWGEDDLYPILINYPQVIDFSGHSHAPINDPRSIHQEHITCLGTGTLSYFELDEFEKSYSTCPPGCHKAAQMLIVEADAENRVRIYPYDLITGNFFPYVWKIDTPWNPDSFLYTADRYRTDVAPYFEDGTLINVAVKENNLTVEFGQAKIDEDYVNDYYIILKDNDGFIRGKVSVWSEYYFYEMPETLSVEFNNVPAGRYYIEVSAESFWNTKCAKPLRSEAFEIK